MRVTEHGFAWMTERLRAAAQGKLALVLEGGYDLDALARSSSAVLGVLRREREVAQPAGSLSAAERATIDGVLATIAASPQEEA